MVLQHCQYHKHNRAAIKWEESLKHALQSKIPQNKEHRETHLVTKPVLLTSIFLKSDVEKKDGSLQISRVTNLNSEYWKGNNVNKTFRISLTSDIKKTHESVTLYLQSIRVAVEKVVDSKHTLLFYLAWRWTAILKIKLHPFQKWLC